MKAETQLAIGAVITISFILLGTVCLCLFMLNIACEIQSTRTTILVEKCYGYNCQQYIEGSGEIMNLGHHYKAEDIKVGDVVEVSYDYTWKDMKVTDIVIMER